MGMLETLNNSLQEIREQLRKHDRLLENLQVGRCNWSSSGCSSLDCRLLALIRETLVEAIEILDDSRKAFKSPRLEALRKKLLRVLADIDRPAKRTGA